MDASAELAGRYRHAVQTFGAVLAEVGVDDWGRATPCAEWDVRELVGHVVDEHRWIAPLLAGRTIAEVEPTLDADVLGDDPEGAWRRWTSESLAAVDDLEEPTDLERIVHLSFGDVPAKEYLAQLVADHVIHAWDLARSIGHSADVVPTGLVDAVLAWFGPMEPLYRGAGVIGQHVDVAADAPVLARLLGMMGRDPAWRPA